MTCGETHGAQAHMGQNVGDNWGQRDAADDEGPSHSNRPDRCESWVLLVERELC